MIPPTQKRPILIRWGIDIRNFHVKQARIILFAPFDDWGIISKIHGCWQIALFHRVSAQ